MLDAAMAARDHIVETSDVAHGVDMLRRRAEEVVDDDAVVDCDPAAFQKLDVRCDTHTDDGEESFDLPARGRANTR